MSTQNDRSARHSPLLIALRWTLLAAATAGALALLALSNHAPAAAAPDDPGALAAPAAPADSGHDPSLRLGAAFVPLSRSAAESLGLAEGTALAVVDVRPDSQAARAGLLERDVITAIAGPVGPGTAGTATTSATWEALCTALGERPSGGALDFFVRRDGQTRIVHVTLTPLDEAARQHDLATGSELLQTACV